MDTMSVHRLIPRISVCFLLLSLPANMASRLSLPLVINTWPFTKATDTAWEQLAAGRTAMEAVVAGCGRCELDQCDGSVGYGSHPDEAGETTLDAMVMDGTTFDVGSVGGLRQVKNAVGVAHAVMTYTTHTLLVGQFATDFALAMGFQKSDLHTNKSITQWRDWRGKHCQPNYRMNVVPDPSISCGPYSPRRHQQTNEATLQTIHPQRLRSRRSGRQGQVRPPVDRGNHDTIGMIVVDGQRKVGAGTSTNGLSHKVPGRIGDSPIVGAGAYADGDVGGAAATGDGDIMMRFLPSFHVVGMMRGGRSPTSACRQVVHRIATKYPKYVGAVIAATVNATHGAGCYGLGTFTYSVRNPTTNGTRKYTVKCVRHIRRHRSIAQ